MSAAVLVFPEKVFFFYLLHLFIDYVVAIKKGTTVQVDFAVLGSFEINQIRLFSSNVLK